MSKNYLFYTPSDGDGKSKRPNKNKRFTKAQFKDMLDHNYYSVFDSKVIRKRFLEFVNKHMARALSEAPLKAEPKHESPTYFEATGYKPPYLNTEFVQEYSDDQADVYKSPMAEAKANRIYRHTKKQDNSPLYNRDSAGGFSGKFGKSDSSHQRMNMSSELYPNTAFNKSQISNYRVSNYSNPYQGKSSLVMSRYGR